KKYQKTLPQLALRWTSSNPVVSTALVGCRNPGEVDDNLGALGWSISDADMKEIDAIFARNGAVTNPEAWLGSKEPLFRKIRRRGMPTQKFAPMTKDFPTFDCDAHVTEPPWLWERAKEYLTHDEFEALRNSIWFDEASQQLVVNGFANTGLGSQKIGGTAG